MTYLFSGTSQDMMAAVLRDLDRAREPGPAQSAYFDQAMAELVGLYDREAEAGPPPPEALERFRRESADALLGFADAVRGYVSITALHAETPAEDELYDLALRRSAIQSLLDDYAGTAVADLVDRDELAELDRDLRRAAPGLDPILTEFVPRGLPAGHWWWQDLSDGS